MEKVEKTFIGFLLSLKNILYTVIVNFVVGFFYYRLYTNGIDSFYIGKSIVILITIFLTAIEISFWVLSYRSFKEKKNESLNIGK